MDNKAILEEQSQEHMMIWQLDDMVILSKMPYGYQENDGQRVHDDLEHFHEDSKHI